MSSLATESELTRKYDVTFCLLLNTDAGALKPSYSMSIKPLDPKVLEHLRAKRVKEVQMMDVLREVCYYVCNLLKASTKLSLFILISV